METTADTLSSGEIAILAALVGAVAAIIPQVIMHYLDRSKTKNDQLRNIIGEERRLAFLLEEYFKEVVMYKTHKQYWYKVSTLTEFDENQSNESHKTHLEKNQKSFEAIDKVRVVMADYFKTVTLFLKLNGKNKRIENLLKEIKKFEPRKASEFDGINNLEDLFRAQDEEEDALNKEYSFYSDCFDKIYKQMTK